MGFYLRRGRALVHLSSSVIKHFNFFVLCSALFSADMEELKVWLYSTAPLLLLKEKELEDEVNLRNLIFLFV